MSTGAQAGAVSRSGDVLDGLLSGARWIGGVITYSDPNTAADYPSSYSSDLDGDGISAQKEGFSRVSSKQLAVIRAVLDADGSGTVAAHAGFTVEGFTRLSVSYAGAGSGAGDLRYARTSDTETAYAYKPSPAMGGDVWLGKSGRSPVAGNYDYFTLLHETGHALGLKHAHEASGFGKMATSWDSVEFSVMSYRSYVGASTGSYEFEDAGAPQSFMMLDIAALQHMYGADFTTNAGNTVYSWRPGSGITYVDGLAGITPVANRIFATVWDGGGTDTYDLSAYSTDLRIDLRPGKSSIFSTTQLADLGGGSNDGHARGNIFNALLYKGSERSLIERAIGGSGDDRIVGNDANNRLIGNDGDDCLIGGEGSDLLIGGKGADVFRFLSARDSRAGSGDRICAGGGSVAFEGAGASGGDRIDLRGVDADTTRSGDQAFHFGTTREKGHLWLVEVGDVTFVRGNVDGDTTVEFEFAIHDGAVRASTYVAGDFLL